MTGENGDVSLSAIMAGDLDENVEAAPETPSHEVSTEAANRDDKGRFAAKEAEAQTTETVEPDKGKVPLAAVSEARNREREAKQEAESLRQQLAELQGQVRLLSQQRQPTQPQPQPPEKKPDFWEDPDGYFKQAMTPMEEKLQRQAEVFSMRMAIKEHGQEAVQTAYEALGKALHSGDPAAGAEYERIKKMDDPYEGIVQWHKRNQTLQRFGNDPDAAIEAELEKRLADPAYQAKFLERIQSSAAANTNRSDPLVKLPPSLSRIPSGGNVSDDGDMSDGSLFRQAMRR